MNKTVGFGEFPYIVHSNKNNGGNNPLADKISSLALNTDPASFTRTTNLAARGHIGHARNLS